MIKEEVILHRERVTRLGEKKYFQIHLPEDTERIIGVEMGAIRRASGATSSGFLAYFGGTPIIDPVVDPLTPLFKTGYNDVIGRISLATGNKPGLFYEDEIRQKDKNWKYADFSQDNFLDEFDQWTHDRKRYETSVFVAPCPAVIEGFYKDSWAAHYNYHVTYDMQIYIWIEKKLKDDTRICS